LIKTISELEKGDLVPQKQDDSLSNYAPMLTKELCEIDFTKSAKEIHNQIRGLSDWPCATSTLNNKRIKIYKSEIASLDEIHSCVGEVIDEKDFVITCGKGSIKITELQAEGGKRMKATDFLRGNPIEKGIMLH